MLSNHKNDDCNLSSPIPRRSCPGHSSHAATASVACLRNPGRSVWHVASRLLDFLTRKNRPRATRPCLIIDHPGASCKAMESPSAQDVAAQPKNPQPVAPARSSEELETAKDLIKHRNNERSAINGDSHASRNSKSPHGSQDGSSFTSVNQARPAKSLPTGIHLTVTEHDTSDSDETVPQRQGQTCR